MSQSLNDRLPMQLSQLTSELESITEQPMMVDKVDEHIVQNDDGTVTLMMLMTVSCRDIVG